MVALGIESAAFLVRASLGGGRGFGFAYQVGRFDFDDELLLFEVLETRNKQQLAKMPNRPNENNISSK